MRFFSSLLDTIRLVMMRLFAILFFCRRLVSCSLTDTRCSRIGLLLSLTSNRSPATIRSSVSIIRSLTWTVNDDPSSFDNTRRPFIGMQPIHSLSPSAHSRSSSCSHSSIQSTLLLSSFLSERPTFLFVLFHRRSPNRSSFALTQRGGMILRIFDRSSIDLRTSLPSAHSRSSVNMSTPLVRRHLSILSRRLSIVAGLFLMVQISYLDAREVLYTLRVTCTLRVNFYNIQIPFQNIGRHSMRLKINPFPLFQLA